MSNTGKQSPLGANVMASLLGNTGIAINPVMTKIYGTSTSNTNYTFGSIVGDTSLKYLSYAINDAYRRGYAGGGTTVSSAVYDSLIKIGSTTIPALGNSPPSTFNWTGYPNWASAYTHSTAATQWGFARLPALQGYNEFNYNNGLPAYEEFLSSFMSVSGFLYTTNSSIMTLKNSLGFLDGTFSNMNDLITADIAGLSLATVQFGKDLVALGKAIDLSTIQTFGLPTNILKVLNKYNAITQDVSVALISTGLPTSDINNIISGATVGTVDQQKLIYAALSLVQGVSLDQVLIALNCKTQGLNSLADLVDLTKLFPTSFNTLTVPLYNLTESPNNSKTYYPIYVFGAVNINLTTPSVVAQVGTQYPPGSPEMAVDASSGIIRDVPEGFGSYLYGIVPSEIAVSCGAFSYSILQVNNILNVPFEKFAQVVSNLETMNGLNTESSVVPVNSSSVSTAYNNLALGSGPYGMYTMSDFYGSMSGLPYVGTDAQELISTIQTTTLTNIYKNLYLATEWEEAVLTVNYTTLSGGTYHIDSITITDSGGGYGRGGAPAPTITIDGGSGATAVAVIGDDSSLGSNGTGGYGRVINVNLTSAGINTSTIPTATIQAPPTTAAGTNSPSGTVGWPLMDYYVQELIYQANAEISTILTNNNIAASKLNTQWNSIGTQLSTEQRALSKGLILGVPYTGLPVTTAYSPTTQISFTDSVKEYARATDPHMQAQTLEAISDLSNVGGQSIVAMMRESRNEVRLASLGIPLDNNIPDTLSTQESKELLANNTLPGATDETLVPPASLKQVDAETGQVVAADPAGYYDPDINRYVATNQPCGTTGVVDTGESEFPGSFAGTEYANVVPPNLNVLYTSGQLLPSTYNVCEAIDTVITCNCDCWKLL